MTHRHGPVCKRPKNEIRSCEMEEASGEAGNSRQTKATYCISIEKYFRLEQSIGPSCANTYIKRVIVSCKILELV